MTAVQHYTLRCDYTDCASTFTALERTASRTRALALRRGWSQEIHSSHPKFAPHRIDLCAVHGAALRSFAPPEDVAGVPCLCDARGQGSCLAHLDEQAWRRVVASAARSLCTTVVDVDMELLTMQGLTYCTRAHARIALAALGYRP